MFCGIYWYMYIMQAQYYFAYNLWLGTLIEDRRFFLISN